MLEKLVAAKPYTKIPYFNGLPLSGTELQYLSPAAVSVLLKCEFSENVWIDSELKRHLSFNQFKLDQQGIISGISTENLKKGIDLLLKQNTNNFMAIVNMGETGHGVFALTEIPEHTVVSIYSGEITLGTRVQNLNTNDLMFYTGNFKFEAGSKRGIGSVMQHLPADTTAFGEEKVNIATTNVIPEFIIVDGIPIVALVTLRKIHPFEQIGFSYNDFWNTRNLTPRLFNHQGESFPTQQFSLAQIKRSYNYDSESCKSSKCTFQVPKLAKVNIVDDKRNLISSYFLSKIQDFDKLRLMVGTPHITKQKNNDVFEVSYLWLQMLNQTNSEGMNTISEILNVSSHLLSSDLNLKNDVTKSQNKNPVQNVYYVDNPSLLFKPLKPEKNNTSTIRNLANFL